MIPVNIAIDPYIESSTRFMEYFSSMCRPHVRVTISYDGIVVRMDATSPILLYNVGGCVSGGCWYLGGVFEVGNEATLVEVYGKLTCNFSDKPVDVTEVRVTGLNVRVFKGLYRLDMFFSLDLPDRGTVFIRR